MGHYGPLPLLQCGRIWRIMLRDWSEYVVGSPLKIFVKSYGCQMNVYDSDRMIDAFVANGAVLTDSYTDANIVILNTCCIREKAEDKLFSDLGRIRPYKERAEQLGNPYVVCVTGCISQLRKEEVYKKSDIVDIILGPQMVQHAFGCVSKKLKSPNTSVEVLTSFNSGEKFQKFTSQYANRGVSAFVTIQEGCNNFCTYCIVPHTRGREVSRPVNDVLNEIKSLVNIGVKEVTLLGQNVNSYHGLDEQGKRYTLARLIYKIADIPGVKRLRYTTSHPKDITDELLIAHKEVSILMPFLHLPVQSGSDAILKAMNRSYSSQEYIECIEKLRNARSDIVFSSDFIVGFPGETDSDFAQTLDLVKKVRYSQAYSFKYSPRPNTKAAIMADQIPESVKEERLEILQNLLNDQQTQFNCESVGRNMKVMLEKPGKHEGQLVGKTEYFQAVSVMNTNNNIGDIVNVNITENLSHSLSGKILNAI